MLKNSTFIVISLFFSSATRVPLWYDCNGGILLGRNWADHTHSLEGLKQRVELLQGVGPCGAGIIGADNVEASWNWANVKVEKHESDRESESVRIIFFDLIMKILECKSVRIWKSQNLKESESEVLEFTI